MTCNKSENDPDFWDYLLTFWEPFCIIYMILVKNNLLSLLKTVRSVILGRFFVLSAWVLSLMLLFFLRIETIILRFHRVMKNISLV